MITNTSEKEIDNFLPEQYRSDRSLKVSHNYLKHQFSDYKRAFEKIEEIVVRGDFTLGEEVDRFERNFCEYSKSKYAIGVGSGTDALMLSLKALGIGPGDEVITTPFTFFATIGAIVTAGATPVFVDINEEHTIDPSQIESKITDKTKCILPVHWSGRIAQMEAISAIAKKYSLFIVEDACHAITAHVDNQYAGNFGDFGCFSMHPLKNLNIWGDGGVIVTNSLDNANKIRLMRNHGLINRNETEIFAYNSRLDTIQAAVANYALEKLDNITESRIANSTYLDQQLASINEVRIPNRQSNRKEVFHLYQVCCDRRDELRDYLESCGVDAKVHYPIPMHLQPAASEFGYSEGDFPVAERVSNEILSLPVHEYVSEDDLDYMVDKIKEFYADNK